MPNNKIFLVDTNVLIHDPQSIFTEIRSPSAETQIPAEGRAGYPGGLLPVQGPYRQAQSTDGQEGEGGEGRGARAVAGQGGQFKQGPVRQPGQRL